MKRTTLSPSLLSILIIFFAVAAMTLMLAGCGSGPASPVSEITSSDVELEPAAVDVSPTDEPASTPVVIEEILAPLQPDTCVDCHTDKDLLIATADPVEEVINENEGEG